MKYEVWVKDAHPQTGAEVIHHFEGDGILKLRHEDGGIRIVTTEGNLFYPNHRVLKVVSTKEEGEK